MCYLIDNRKMLLLHRNKGKTDIHDGFYVPPGGRTERGERGIDCIIREFREETGLTIIKPNLKVIATFYNEGRKLGERKDPEDWCVETYIANQYTGSLKEEHEKAKPFWINLEDLPTTKMHIGDREIIKLLDKKGVFQTIAHYRKEDLIKFETIQVA